MTIYCTNCNAELQANASSRSIEGSDTIVEKIRRCSKCKHVEVIGRSSKEIIKLEKEIRMMQKKLEFRLRDGKSVTSLKRAIAHKKSAVARISRDLGL